VDESLSISVPESPIEICSVQRDEQPASESLVRQIAFPKPNKLVETLLLSAIKLPPQIRSEYDLEPIKDLADSMRLHGQLQPGGVDEDNNLIFGYRRYFAKELLGESTMDVVRYPGRLPAGVFKTLQLIENIQRLDISSAEFYQALKQLTEDFPGITRESLAKLVCKSLSTISRAFKVDEAIPAVKDAFLNGELNRAQVVEIAMRPDAEQPAALTDALNGATRERLGAGRRKAKRTPVKKQTDRIEYQSPAGVKIVASGPALTPENVIEALGDFKSEMETARDSGVDLRNFEGARRAAAASGGAA
jgi:ParB/RepB/Spo0J family partition protein